MVGLFEHLLNVMHGRSNKTLFTSLVVMTLLFAGYIALTASYLPDYSDKTNTAHVDENVKTVIDQNKRLLEILEAQNRLFDAKITVLESRQYELQSMLTNAMQRQADLLEKYYGTKQLASFPAPAPYAAAKPLTEVNLPEIVAQQEQVQQSIATLKQDMQVEVPNEQSVTVQQAESPTGH